MPTEEKDGLREDNISTIATMVLKSILIYRYASYTKLTYKSKEVEKYINFQDFKERKNKILRNAALGPP